MEATLEPFRLSAAGRVGRLGAPLSQRVVDDVGALSPPAGA